MLQRIQTIFLLLAILINVAVLFVPVWQTNAGGTAEVITGLSITTSDPVEQEVKTSFMEHEDSQRKGLHTAIVALIAISAVWLAFVIFRYNNRVQQARFGYLAIVLIILEIVAIVLLSQSGNADDSLPHFGFAFPVASLLLVWMAINRIKKDEELVRSVDRIR